MQKEYARKPLTYVNPQTGNAPSGETGVAMVQISKENPAHVLLQMTR